MGGVMLADEVKADRRAACKLPDRLTPSQWAEKNRVLSAKAGAAEPGPWRAERTPYAVEPMDALRSSVEQIVLVWCTQVGKSTVIENIVGFVVEEDPGPLLYVMPTESSIKETLEERLKPLIDSSDSLRAHVGNPDDIQQTGIEFDTMRVHFGWSGSPNSLARRPCRYVLFDECDKFVPFAGREADPLSLGEQRTTTYGHRARIVKVSTPTTREGNIWRAWEGCGDQRRYWVPCPHCSSYQVLTFPQVRWPKDEAVDKVTLTDRIKEKRLAVYECIACGGKILDHHKPKMLLRGKWVSQGQSIASDGTVSGDRPRSARVGYHLSALYSPWVSWSKMAVQFILAEGDPGATMNFRNSWLAEPFETQVSKREPSALRDKAQFAATLGAAGQVRVVPSWGVLLIATCDVQKDHCYWQVDAWGYEMQSKRVAVGIAATLDEVYRQVFAPEVPFMAEGGGPVMVASLIVDSGFRKDEVTEFARKDPRRVHLAKGLSTYFGPIAEQKIEKASGVIVWNINTKQSKDTLDRLVGDSDPLKWQVFAGIGDDYCLQMTSEHKILDPQSRQEVWKQKTSAAPNHYWDCAAMSTAVAAAMGASMAKPIAVESPPVPPKREEDAHGWTSGRPDGWMR